MAILVECPKCRHRQYDDTVPCKQCNASLVKFSGKIYWIEYRNAEGVRRRERIGPNKSLAETTIMKRLVARAEGRLLDKKKDDKVRFDQLVGWFLALHEIKRKSSFDRDKRSLDKLIGFFKTKLASQITPALISEYQAHRLAEKSYRGENTKPATVNRETACLKTMFNKAIRDGKLEKNPMRGVKLLAENNERDRVLSPKEWEDYKANCPAWYLPIAITAYRTAMRKGEILNLTTSRLDLKEGFIRLKAEDTKTGYGRAIPVHPELMEVIKEALKVRPLSCSFVFHRDGSPFTPHDIRLAHEKVCKEAGISGFVFHDFRHTCINNWRKDGHDYFKIMAVSGHKTISVFKRYNLVDEAELRTLIFSMDTYKDTTEGMEKKNEAIVS
jgi:integrase